MRILIVEDDPISRKLFYGILKNIGDCMLAGDGLEALHKFRTAYLEKKQYSVVLLDIMLPKIDGLTVLKKIRSIEKELRLEDSRRAKIIVLTAKVEKEVEKSAYDYGCDFFLRKPVSGKILMENVERLVGEH